MKTQRLSNTLEPETMHSNVVCRACGRTAEISGAMADAACLSAVAEYGFVVLETEVLYRGICPDCLS